MFKANIFRLSAEVIPMKTVAVLMSTYNGEKYLKEQLDSLLKQKKENFDIHYYIRDDGSTDETKTVLENYRTKYPDCFTIEYGDNRGFIRSFMLTLEMTSQEDYYAFCDQDDVWMDNKILAAVKKLEECHGRPSLYCSNCIMVNSKLEPIGFLRTRDWPIYESKVMAITYPFAFGCTMVFNRELKKEVMRYSPKYLHEHDFWISMVCTYIGNVIYDKNSYILYRRHTNNYTRLSIKRMIELKVNEFRLGNYYSRVAWDLMQGYSSDIEKKDAKDLFLIMHYKENIKAKLKLLVSKDIKKGRRLGTLSLKIMILFSRF